MKIKCPAKINLTLNVLEKRKDGFHEIESVMQTVDLFDYLPTGLLGKPAGNDIKEKKYTLPLIHALEQAPQNDRKKIIRLINSSASDAKKLKTVTDFVIQNGGLDYCYKVMDEFSRKAVDIIHTFPKNEVTAALEEVVSYVVKRKS